ncbi:MAG: DcaP family trimeric outer membrane transporter [Xanthomonadales bacterium]|nr:DcaP family trimeric outer membrane transporter [Xanthomonadales bacterium]
MRDDLLRRPGLRGRLLGLGLVPWLLLSATVLAQDGARDAEAPGNDVEQRLQALEAVIARQQEEIESQRKAIEDQRDQLTAQYELIQKLRSDQAEASDSSGLADAAPPAPAVQVPPPAAGDDTPALADAETPSEGQQAATDELQRRTAAGESTGEVNVAATLYDPSNTVYDPNFPGAWHLPGTTAAMRIAGFVNLGLVTSLDPVQITDRFIVGSIPPSGVIVEGAQSGTDITASQSRLNFEVREQTTHGEVRAFLEGDFEENNETFRLRHAFGQYGFLLAGKTWSTFTNPNSLPEEVDFEGVNGMVIVRQPQIRLSPQFGEGQNLVVSVEEPRTDVVNGSGSKGNWDLVASVDRLSLGDLLGWDYQVSFVLRDLQGQLTQEGMASGDVSQSSATGWGITTSGRRTLERIGNDDFLLWQLTYGKGIGRYINDLATIGGGDAVFDPEGNLRALPLFAGFVSYRHNYDGLPKFMSQWPGIMRSNLTLSWINVDTYDFQEGGDYDYTLRASGNLLYFPTQNVRIGAELLWGMRKNQDGSDGDAVQVQLSARYNF